MSRDLRLGVNIDHVATIRNARGGGHPDPTRAALLAVDSGADGITAHLREDRRHISDYDIERLMQHLEVPLNFEMAPTAEMLATALRHRPHAACIVPERREEVTTEGGLDVVSGHNSLKHYVDELNGAGIRVSFFIDPEERQLEGAKALGAPVVELHTGAYCEAYLESGNGPAAEAELARLVKAAAIAENLGLECHAGHGLTFDTVGPVAAIPSLKELNIGHFLVGEGIFSGLASAIQRMRALMDKARADADGARSA